MSLVIVTDTSPVEAVLTTAAEPTLERILVATGSECDGDAAIALAARIAAREGAVLDAVTVPADVPSRAVAARARAGGADLIVLGIGSLTSTQLAVQSDVPVLAVSLQLGQLPALATIHAESPRAARAMLAAAAHVLADGATVTVARPHWSEPHDLPGWSALDEWWSLHRGRRATPLRWLDLEAAAEVATELTVVPVPGATPAVRSLMSGRVVRAFQRASSSVLAVPVDVLRPARGTTRVDD